MRTFIAMFLFLASGCAHGYTKVVKECNVAPKAGDMITYDSGEWGLVEKLVVEASTNCIMIYKFGVLVGTQKMVVLEDVPYRYTSLAMPLDLGSIISIKEGN